MALKIYQIGGQIRLVQDGIDLDFIPSRNFDFSPTDTQVLLRNTQEGGQQIRVLISEIQDESGAAVGDREAVIVYLSSLVGFNNGGGSGGGAVNDTWVGLVNHWSVEPFFIALITGGDVFGYTLSGITRYRFIPTDYNPTLDAFYSDFDGTNLTNLITTRG